MNTAEQMAALKSPFYPSEVDWRIGSCGKKKDGTWWALALAYIDGRAVQDRLDAVVGCENWRPEYREWAIGTPGVLCGLSIRLGGEWITKWDGADQPDTEPMKGGLSNALKRAAVPWGIGRYLYALPKTYADIREDGAMHAELKIKRDGKVIDSAWVNWNPPTLPDWAIPADAPKAAVRAPSVPQEPRSPAKVAVVAPNPGPRPYSAKPDCPRCGGEMWDNRTGKKNPKAPDFKCMEKNGDCKDKTGRYPFGMWEEKGAESASAPAPSTESFSDFPAALEPDDSELPF